MSQYPSYDTTTQQSSTGSQGYQTYQQPSYTPSPYGSTPSPYGQASPAGYTMLPEHPSAQTAMILGILGLVAIQLCAPFAWWMAAKAKKEVAANPGRYRDSGNIQAGYVMGIIGTILLALTTLFILFYFGAIIFAVSSAR